MRRRASCLLNRFFHGLFFMAWLYGKCYGAASSLPVRVSPKATFSQRFRAAKALLDESPLVDGHNDLSRNLRDFLHNKLSLFNFTSDLKSNSPWNDSVFAHTDLPRLRKGKVAAQLWSVYVPCESQYLNGVQLLMEQVDVIRRIISSHRDYMTLAKSAEDILNAFKQKSIASLIGVEGGHAIGSSMGVIRSLYDLGVRSLTLTHRCHTPWAECSDKTKEKPNSRGLTPFGKDIVREMNRIGMIIDLSHSSRNTARDTLSLTKAPVIFSHSAAKALCDKRVNIPDDIIEALSKNNGLIMVTFESSLLSCSKNASLSDVISHIKRIRMVAGVDHVGIGAGFDGLHRAPNGLSDVSHYPDLFADLLKDGSWSIQDLKKLAGLNFIRVFKAVEKVRDEQMEEDASEEIIPIHDIDSRWPCRYKFANLEAIRS